MTNQNYRWLIHQSKPAHRWLFIVITLGIIAALLMIAQAGILALLIDHIYIGQATQALILQNLIIFLAICFLRAGITWFRELAAFQSAKKIKDTVRENCLMQLSQLTPLQLSQFNTGELTSTLIEQIEALHGFFSDYLPQMTLAVFIPIIILCFVFSQNWITGTILLVTAPLIPLFMALIGVNTAKLKQAHFQTLARMSAHFLDHLQGLTTLVLFNRARAQSDSIATISNEYREKTMTILRIAFLSTATLELFSTISIAIIAVYLGLGLLGLIHIGFGGVTISLASALFILLLAPEFFMPLRQLGVFYHAKAEAIGAAEAIIHILEAPQNTDQNKLDCPYPIEHLLFKNMCFNYGNKKIFDYFNADITFGNCVVITGPSGSGKSTLLNLIAKFISPAAGEILINEKALADIDTEIWRNQIALLHQHPRLFHGTLYDNIALSKPQASPAEINTAATQAGVMDFAALLPEGLHTKIGEQNLGLSGGQAQRIALARIILKDAPIVLLDEPTAHLDQNNTDIVIHLLKKWCNNKTVIMATHDSRLIAYSNKIIAIG